MSNNNEDNENKKENTSEVINLDKNNTNEEELFKKRLEELRKRDPFIYR